ncbi:hypothetical protein BGX28_000659 [Mortierella sp. GBA30]|nr:hypothetical protein BGX28_000659 [Mortierella sp. GBA30]
MTSARTISRLGIGSYRLALGVPDHERILYKALERQQDPRLNINLIDTSSNYSNGRSEQLIGKVLAHPRHNTLTRDELVIATKFGYIQNENMRLLSEGVFQRVPPEEIVEYSRECYHSIHPEFMRDQLTRSLERLNTKFVDILFVHNPEYYLMANIKGTEENVKKHQDILLSRLAVLFEELEREVDRGRIRSYGISSNSFSLKPSHAHFLPYQDLVKMATRAFERVRDRKQKELQSFQENLSKREREQTHQFPPDKAPSTSHPPPSPPKHPVRTSHGLGFLQMPGNLLEMEGVLTTAKWAKSQGLRVFLNRPLNAMSLELGPMRLASYPAPQSPTYTESKAQILELLSTLGNQRENLRPKMQRLKEMIEDLDTSLRSNTLSIIQMEGASVRNQLHQELAKPVKIKSLPLHPLHASSKSEPHSQSKNQETHRRDTKTRHEEHVSQQNTGNQKDHHHHHASSTSLADPLLEKSTAATAAAAAAAEHSTSARPSLHEMEELIKGLDRFLIVFNQQVRSQESGRVEAMLAERGIDLEGDSIEQFAVDYLLEHAQVDSVLLGMKREPYVDFARNMLKTLTEVEQ